MSDEPATGVADRVVVITGASKGIGRTLATAFVQRGARLALMARSVDALAELGQALGSDDVLTVPSDVTEERSLADAFDRITDRFGQIDSVVVNAGVSPVARRAHNLSIHDWQYVLDVNLTGGFLTARAAYPHLAASGRGRLVFTTSVMADAPRRGLSAYAASKAGLEGLVRALAADWAGDSILVNAVALGFFDVGLGAAFQSSDRLRGQVQSRTPLARLGAPDELADAFTLLAGDGSSYMTGQVLALNGGYGLG
jgi:NAD(P)-dependent dehydrogenase (short-subunit alcohol dehydrogenase family)